MQKLVNLMNLTIFSLYSTSCYRKIAKKSNNKRPNACMCSRCVTYPSEWRRPNRFIIILSHMKSHLPTYSKFNMNCNSNTINSIEPQNNNKSTIHLYVDISDEGRIVIFIKHLYVHTTQLHHFFLYQQIGTKSKEKKKK